MEFLIVIIIMALIFDYINGFHDAANSIATIVSTKVLTPFQAVVWAAFFNFVAFMIFKDHAVANTIGKTVNKEFITLPVIFAGLIAAIAWNLITWWYGIPSSSSHTLIGGFAGAAITAAFMKSGVMPLKDIIDSAKITKTVSFIFLAPLIGMVISMIITLIMMTRNVWVRSGILAIIGVLIWFSFIGFQENKNNENISKFFKVDKYEKDIKDPKKAADIEKNEKKLAKAKADAAACTPFVHEYEKKGGKAVAAEISQNVNLNDVTTARIEDKLKLFFEVDRLKIVAEKDPSQKTAYEYAKASYDSLKPMAKKHAELGLDGMADKMIATGLVQANKIGDFNKAVKIDITKDLGKELEKGDNHLIRYGLLLVLLIMIISFFYNEIVNEPSSMKTSNNFKRLQLLSSALFSIGHGGNDAQKVMGIIAAALMANGTIADIKNMPDWVPLACYSAIALGTLSGGWKIVKTMGSRITKVTPLEGVCAETAGAITLFVTEQMGIPVSTTHTITGSIIGVGATKRLSAVRWGVTKNLFIAWVITIPISALFAAISYFIVSRFI